MNGELNRLRVVPKWAMGEIVKGNEDLNGI
jgi:hypothetical protein